MAYTQAAGLAFWKDLDNQTLYSSEGRKILGQAKAQDIQTLFFQAKQQGQYPGLIQASLTPAKKAAWQKLSKLQRDLFTHHFGGNWDDIRSAFEDFAQGVLVDNDANRPENND